MDCNYSQKEEHSMNNQLHKYTNNERAAEITEQTPESLYKKKKFLIE
jgi:hypothetical protein